MSTTITRRTQSTSEPISEVTTVTNPIGVKNVSGNQINPATTGQFTPLEVDSQDNLAATANTNIWETSKAPTNTPCLWRVFVCSDTAGIFSAIVKKGAAAERKVKLNSGATLVANAGYLFDILVHSTDVINFQMDTTSNLLVLRIQEIVGAVQ